VGRIFGLLAIRCLSLWMYSSPTTTRIVYGLLFSWQALATRLYRYFNFKFEKSY